MDVLLLGKNGRMNKKIGVSNKMLTPIWRRRRDLNFTWLLLPDIFWPLSCAISRFRQEFELCFGSIRAVLFSFVSGA